MIIPQTILNKYNYCFPYIEALGCLVNKVLFNYCERNNYAYSWRYKTIESLSEKIESGRYESWESIDDLFASSIIIQNLNQEKEVVLFLDKVFNILEKKLRGSTQKNPEIFRFDSTRLICQYSSSEPDLNEEIKKLRFEVQIKTAFEHAWAVSTHSLAYKGDTIDWRILRLSSQIKATVEQMDMLISSAHNVTENIVEHLWLPIKAKADIETYLKQKLVDKKIPEELSPDNIYRFADNIINLIKFFDGYRRNKIRDHLKTLFAEVDKEIAHFNLDSFPRSVSLYQFFIGSTVTNRLINPKNIKDPMPITPELEMIFPEVKKIESRFDYK